MWRIIGTGILVLTLQACVYGTVNDASSGSVISAANVRVISGSCSGAGCTGSPVTEVTDSSGIYIFDAYGNQKGAANVKIIMPAIGEEAIQLQVQKAGYVSRTVYHRPQYEELSSGGDTYLASDVVPVYLCPLFSLDSDGDSICNDAEARYGTSPTNSDTDGDNISDAAELFGSGGVDLRSFGAHPLKKDLFIEADYFPGLGPDPTAVDMVVQAFANAPVSNPDGTTGIALHIEVDQQIAAADVDLNLSPVWTDFDVIKADYFASRRAPFFHYTLFAHQYDGGTSSGISRGIPGHDFVVSLGTWPVPGGTVLQQAGTLMHEFGHNIGLRHGGNENENFKPNYLSIMSYSYQVVGLTVDGVSGQVDYSRLRIASVNEASLNEFTAYAPLAPTTEADLAHYRPRKCNTLMTGTASSNLDFNGNGVISSPVATSLNCDADAVDVFAASQNDWTSLVYDGAGTIGDGLLGVREIKGLSNFTREDLVEPCMTIEDLKRQ